MRLLLFILFLCSCGGGNKPTTPQAKPPVKPHTNQKPKASVDKIDPIYVYAGVNLDATLSFDSDGEIISYHWEQVDGPTKAKILSADSALAYADGLIEGWYSFRITVMDDDSATDSKIQVIKVGNPKPQ